MMHDFEVLPHTADIKIRVYGTSLKELFVHAAVGMFQVLGPRAPGCRQRDGRLWCPLLPRVHDVTIDATDREALLVDFLSHLVYLSDLHNEAYLAVEVHELSDTLIRATVSGVHVDGFEVVELKAVTYHDLAITNVNEIWQVDIVFDI